MHVNVRIAPRWSFTEVRRAALALSREIERRAPALATSKWWKEERHGVFLDYNQNAKDRTTCSAYSVRPLPDARVSAPLALGRGRRLRSGRLHGARRCRRASRRAATRTPRWTPAPGSLDGLLELAARDEAAGLGDAPWPPHFRKMEGEAPRVAPSRARRAARRRGERRARARGPRARARCRSSRSRTRPTRTAALAGLERWKARHAEAAGAAGRRRRAGRFDARPLVDLDAHPRQPAPRARGAAPAAGDARPRRRSDARVAPPDDRSEESGVVPTLAGDEHDRCLAVALGLRLDARVRRERPTNFDGGGRKSWGEDDVPGGISIERSDRRNRGGARAETGYGGHRTGSRTGDAVLAGHLPLRAAAAPGPPGDRPAGGGGVTSRAAVAITGIGAVTPVGATAIETAASLRAGICRFREDGFYVPLGVDDEDRASARDVADGVTASAVASLPPSAVGAARIFELALRATRDLLRDRSGRRRARSGTDGLVPGASRGGCGDRVVGAREIAGTGAARSPGRSGIEQWLPCAPRAAPARWRCSATRWRRSAAARSRARSSWASTRFIDRDRLVAARSGSADQEPARQRGDDSRRGRDGAGAGERGGGDAATRAGAGDAGRGGRRRRGRRRSAAIARAAGAG